MIAIGIDLGGTNIKAALVHEEHGILEKISIPTEAEKGEKHVFDRIGTAVQLLLDKHPATPVGIGMGTPGMVSLDRTVVKNPPNLPGWETVKVTDEIEKRTGYRCIIENDANLAALGSSRFGAGSSFDSMILITLGTGVGGGIIYNRQLFRGTTGSASELGHVIIDYNGPYSNSNTRGGIEAYLGQKFLSRIASAAIRRHPGNPLYAQFHNNYSELEPVDLFREAEKGNRLAENILRESGEKLGYAIVNYIHILDIRKIVVSGGVANAGQWLTSPARKTALENLMPPFHEDFEIIYEPLGNDAALYGASSLALEHL
ncbi:MAG: ROK family protein [Balneolaceae bacterium]